MLQFKIILDGIAKQYFFYFKTIFFSFHHDENQNQTVRHRPYRFAT